MALDVNIVALSDVLETIVDYRGKTPPKSESGITVLTAASVKNGRVLKDKVSYISQETYDRVTTRGFPEKGDVLITTEAPFGEVAPFPTDRLYHITRRIMALRPKKDLIDSGYLLYTLLSDVCQNQLKSRTRGTTVPRVLKTDITGLEFQLPSLEYQRKVSTFLSSIDSKIDLNRQINETLEQMAQALFKSWFVDFDPVIDNVLDMGNPIPEELEAKAEQRKQLREAVAKGEVAAPALPDDIRSLFPSEFEFTEEMGWIPKGWGVNPLSNIAALQTKSSHPSKEPDATWMHFSIPAFDENNSPTLDLGADIKSSKYRIPKTAVLASKLNPDTPRVWLPDIKDEAFSVCSTEFMPFVPIKAELRSFLYELLCSEPVQTAICNRVSGSTGSRQRVKPKEIAELPVLTPTGELIEIYSKQSQVFHRKIQSGLDNNEQLVVLRNTLLPKLISGELQIPEAEQQIAEALN